MNEKVDKKVTKSSQKLTKCLKQNKTKSYLTKSCLSHFKNIKKPCKYLYKLIELFIAYIKNDIKSA